MNCKEIIINYLKENGYNGLTSFECGCGIEDLQPCCGSVLECEPAYEKEADCKECKNKCDGYDEDNNTRCFTVNKPVDIKE